MKIALADLFGHSGKFSELRIDGAHSGLEEVFRGNVLSIILKLAYPLSGRAPNVQRIRGQ